MNRHILVTGAAGFIGASLVTGLNVRGWQVTAVDRRRVLGEVAARAKVVVADFQSADVLDRVRQGEFHAVVHQAAISNTLETDWVRLQEDNVDGSLQLAQACTDGGAVYIYASSFSVYGATRAQTPVPEGALGGELCSGPLNAYARSKLLVDQSMSRFTAAGLRWVGLRYTNVFGAGEWLDGRSSSILAQIVTKAARGECIDLFSDSLLASRDYVPDAHLVGLIDLLLRHDVSPGCYNAGSGCAVSFATLLSWCAEFDATGHLDVRLVPNPIKDRYQYWTCADQSKLNAALPMAQRLEIAAVRLEAERLFQTVRREPSDDL